MGSSILFLSASMLKDLPPHVLTYMENSLKTKIRLSTYGGYTISKLIGPLGEVNSQLQDSEVLFFLGGQNDFSKGDWQADPDLLGKTIAIRLRLHLCRLAEKNKALKIVSLPLTKRQVNTNLHTRFADSLKISYIEKINQAIETFHANFHACPCHKDRILICVGNFDYGKILADDGIHLSSEGKGAIIAQAIAQYKSWVAI